MSNGIVAYLGPAGTFCEQAARKYFPNPGTAFFPCHTITDVFEAVNRREDVRGVVPLENSLQGSERATLDLLLQSNLKVQGEVDIRVIHNLIAKPGTSAEDIETIISHPQALAQCRNFLEKNFPKAEQKEATSTARAVEMLREQDRAAAIGTEIAAERYGMEILYRGTEDDPNNFTRFFVLGQEDAKLTGRDKTSLIFSVKDEPGALYAVLGTFASRNINLTKVESRPERGKPWKYIFYLDFEGHQTEERSIEAVGEMAKRCIFLKVLGSYPRASNSLR